MGRPPAKWMYEAATKKEKVNPFYSFVELAEMLNVSYRSIKKFCNSHKVEGKYVGSEEGPAIRLVSFKDFQKKMKEHVTGYCR